MSDKLKRRIVAWRLDNIEVDVNFYVPDAWLADDPNGKWWGAEKIDVRLETGELVPLLNSTLHRDDDGWWLT